MNQIRKFAHGNRPLVIYKRLVRLLFLSNAPCIAANLHSPIISSNMCATCYDTTLRTPVCSFLETATLVEIMAILALRAWHSCLKEATLFKVQ